MSILKKSNIPNVLSVFRICLVPIFVHLFIVREKHLWAMAVFLLAGTTDVIDGYLARHNNWITDIGKVLDPLADKCMQIAALICLGLSELVSWWIVSVLVIKEALLLVGATNVLKKRKVYVQSSWYGKAGTVAFYIVVVLLVTVKNMPGFVRLLLGIFLIGFMLFALIMYFINYRKNIMTKYTVKNS